MVLPIARFICTILDDIAAATGTTRMGYDLSYHVADFDSPSLTFQPLPEFVLGKNSTAQLTRYAGSNR
jgi:hypothetical protein